MVAHGRKGFGHLVNVDVASQAADPGADVPGPLEIGAPQGPGAFQGGDGVVHHLAGSVHQVKVVDVAGPADFVDQIPDGILAGHLHHHAGPGSGFQGID